MTLFTFCRRSRVTPSCAHAASPPLRRGPFFHQNGQPVNGGVPQNASLEAHLKQVEVDIDATIPDVNFAGLAIIDWEAWRPLWAWNFDALNIYQVCSTMLEQRPAC